MSDLEQQTDETEQNPTPEEANPCTPEGENERGQKITEPTVIIEGLQGAFIEVADDAHGAWHWALWSGNGRIVARSGQTHGSFKACVQALRTIVKLWAEKIPIVRSHRA